MKNLRKTFFGSVVSLLICFTMLLGTTFAWFTDSVSSVGNKIIAGTLDIELYQYVYDEATDTWSWKDISAVTDALFDYDLWEPGYTEYVVLKVVNNGNLALKWKATFSSTNVLSELADVINVYVNPTAPAAEGTYNNFDAPASRAAALDYTPAGTVRSFVSQIEDVTKGELKANEEACLTLVLQMDPNAGNDYMNLDLGGAFDISIVATQNTVESDDFGTDYDADAVYPGCEHTSISTETSYTKTATGHTAVTTEKCDDCHTVISTTTGTEDPHDDANSDNACDVCGYGVHVCTRASNYAWDNGDDGTGRHYYIACSDADCTNGNYMKKIYEDHIWGENGKCTICSLCKHTTYIWQQYPGTETHRYVCKTCGEPSTGTDGQLVACSDANSDNKCDVCGGTVASAPAACSHVDEDHADHFCDICNEEVSTCEYAVTPNNDGATHTVTVCSVCNKGNNVGTDCEDTDSDNKCDVCDGDVTSAPAVCDHSISVYTQDAGTTHIGSCTCGQNIEAAKFCTDGDNDGACDNCEREIAIAKHITIDEIPANTTVVVKIVAHSDELAAGTSNGIRFYLAPDKYNGNTTAPQYLTADANGDIEFLAEYTVTGTTTDITFKSQGYNVALPSDLVITEATVFTGTMDEYKIANGAEAYEIVETQLAVTNSSATQITYKIDKRDLNSTVVVHFKGTSDGLFRYWISETESQRAATKITAIDDAAAYSEFDVTVELVLDNAAGQGASFGEYLLFKGASGGGALNNLNLEYVGIYYGTKAEYDAAIASYTTNP